MNWLTKIWDWITGKDKLPQVKSNDVAVPLPLPDTGVIESPTGADPMVAINYTIDEDEGTKYTNDKNDSGGPTKFGITLNDLQTYNNSHPDSNGKIQKVTATDVQNMTRDLAVKIHIFLYWDPMHLGQIIDQNMATVIYNLGLLYGTGTVIKWAQTISGAPSDGKVGPVTLKAINGMVRTEFIQQMCVRAKLRATSLVAANPKLDDFIDGWNNRTDRLTKLAVVDPVKVPVTGRSEQIGDGLINVAKKAGLLTIGLEKMIAYQIANRPQANPRYWVDFDIKAHSKTKRLHVYDRGMLTVQSFYVAHGKNSDPDYDGQATVFSNTNGSLMSCLGILRTAETYQMSGHGRALRLEGLEATNSNARERGIVFHGCTYADDDFVKANGKTGRSWGCPAIDQDLVQSIIDQIEGGSLFIIR